MIDAVATDQTYQLKDIDLIDPSPLNPRKTFDQARLADLCASIKEAGVIEPLVVRPGKKDRVELVAGERRWRAGKMAGLTALPVVLRSLTDAQVLTLMAIENEQRDDIHPLERAAGYQALMKIDPSFTPESIAKRIGKSKRWVQLCLQYLTLIPEVQQAFREGTITAGHADLIVRLAQGDQKHALDACFDQELNYGIFELGEKQEKVRVLWSVRDLDEWIKGNIRLPLEANAPQLELLPDVQEAIDAAAVANAPKLLELIDSHYVDPKIKPAPLTRKHWTFVKKGQKCDTQQRGVIVFGAARGRIFTVCTGVGVCALHWPETVEKPRAPKSSTGKQVMQRPKKSPAEIKRDHEAGEQARAAKLRAELWTTKVRGEATQKARAIVAKLKPTSAPALALLASAVRESAWLGRPLPKKPTVADLLVAIVEHTAEDSDSAFAALIAKPLGLDLKPLFAAAAPKPKAEKKTAPTKTAEAKSINWKTHFADEDRKKKKPAGKKRPTLGKGK